MRWREDAPDCDDDSSHAIRTVVSFTGLVAGQNRHARSSYPYLTW